MPWRAALQAQWQEYKRPWKLFALAVGLALLIFGSFHYQALDWDIPISFISMHVILCRRP
jgi:hypothetical protein